VVAGVYVHFKDAEWKYVKVKMPDGKENLKMFSVLSLFNITTPLSV
jgi:hypothetical protein